VASRWLLGFDVDDLNIPPRAAAARRVELVQRRAAAGLPAADLEHTVENIAQCYEHYPRYDRMHIVDVASGSPHVRLVLHLCRRALLDAGGPERTHVVSTQKNMQDMLDFCACIVLVCAICGPAKNQVDPEKVDPDHSSSPASTLVYTHHPL
jgi:hypothetical protein